jgi:hypothetical protein
MEVILDSNSNWIGYSCLQRTFSIYLGSLTVVAFPVGLFCLLMWLPVSSLSAEERGDDRIFPDRPGPRLAVVAFAIFTVLILSSAFALQPLRSSLVATGTSVVERGCYLGSDYKDVYDLRKSKVRYWLEVRRKTGERIHHIGVSQAELRGVAFRMTQDNFPELPRFFPGAMRDYADRMRADGQVVPQEVHDL